MQRPDVRAELTALRAERQRVVTEQLIKTEEYLASAAPTAIRVLIELATNSSGKVPFYVQATASDRLLAFMALGGGTQAPIASVIRKAIGKTDGEDVTIHLEQRLS